MQADGYTTTPLRCGDSGEGEGEGDDAGGSSGNALHCTALRCAALAGAMFALLYVASESGGGMAGTSECTTRCVCMRERASE
jgi:hypothetical protein